MSEDSVKALRAIDELNAEATERLSGLFCLCTTDAEVRLYREVKSLLNQIHQEAAKALGDL